MEIVTYLLLFVVTFFAMEGAAWATHKYVMHGFLWYLHEDHHTKSKGIFEKNDAFFLIFAIPSWLSIMFGLMYEIYGLVAVGFGVAAYGFAYFLVHEVLIHQRLPWFRNPKHPYLKKIIKAHRKHHASRFKEDGQCFGMLFVPKRFRENEAL